MRKCLILLDIFYYIKIYYIYLYYVFIAIEVKIGFNREVFKKKF